MLYVLCRWGFVFYQFYLNKTEIFLKVTLICLLCSIAVELTQLISKLGSCDIDDVILNTSGRDFGLYICF